MKNLTEAVEGFLTAQAGDVSESTRRWYRRRLSSFSEFAGPVRVEDVKVQTIRAWRAHLVEKELSVHYVHGCQRALRRFFAWLVAEGVVERNVAKEVPLIRLPPQAPKALSDDDLRRLLERLPHEDVRDRAIILLLADTGCRVGGLCSMTLQSLDLPGRCAMVVEKGQRGRRVYFTEVTAETLALYLAVRPAADADVLFVSRAGRPLSTNGVRLMLERVGERAGVKGRCNAHSFRHAFARNFLRNGGNLAVLGRLLGHAPGSPVTARYYAVFDDRDLREYHERYSPLAGVNGRAGDEQSSAQESEGL